MHRKKKITAFSNILGLTSGLKRQIIVNRFCVVHLSIKVDPVYTAKDPTYLK